MTRPDSPLPEQTDAPSRNDAPGPAQLERLPYGHPSSPYNSDGSRKPPVPDLRSLELPLPSEDSDDTPAPPDSDSWHEAAPRFREAWQSHLERWPEEEKKDKPSEHAEDEPGSWRSDSGAYLKTEQNKAVDRSLHQIRDSEPSISSDMRDIEAATPAARLTGFEFRVKDGDRLKEKVADRLNFQGDRSIKTILNGIPDAIRYTFEINGDAYSETYRETCESLETRGHESISVRNSWGDEEYRGINTRWRDSSGQRFEVQFHTPESFEAKQLTHKAYERIRISPEAGPENLELHAFQKMVSAAVPTPPGATEIKK
jgi:hypothetical protein